MTEVIEVPRRDLRWALLAALPHAARSHPEPAACGVRLEVTAGGHLYVAGTDHFTLGVAKVEVRAQARPAGPAAATIARVDAMEIVRRLKGDGGPAELCFYEDGELAFGWRSRYEGIPGFPDWRRIVACYLRYPPAVPGAEYGFAPGLLARFAAAGDEGEPLAFVPVRRHYPAMVAVGPRFTGVAMSVRADGLGTRGALAEWRADFPQEEQP